MNESISAEPDQGHELELVSPLDGGVGERARVEPHHDAVDRWFIEGMGIVPSPELKREFKGRVEKLVLRTAADDDRDLGELLFRDGYDPDEELRTALKYGVDLSGDPAWQKLKRLVDEASKRAASRRSPSKSPDGLDVAASHRLEKLLKREADKAEKAKARHSRKTRLKPARSGIRDRSILLEIQGFLAADIAVRMTPKKIELVRPEISSAAPADSRDALIWLPHWEKASLDLRAMAMGLGAASRGARDFTLHLSDEAITYAQGVGEMKFARRMRRRVEDQLARTFKPLGITPPDFAFFVEQGKGQNPHLHGFIFIPEGSTLKVVRDALRSAGGEGWKPRGKDKTQAEIGMLYEPVGWVGYCSKFSHLTKAQLGDNTFAASNAIRKMGRDWYATIRSERGLLFPRAALAAT